MLDFQFLCSYYVLMRKGKWTRWGRGNCEGNGLEIGNALRASVFRNKDRFWEVLDQVKKEGAEGILVCPIEKMIV